MGGKRGEIVSFIWPICMGHYISSYHIILGTVWEQVGKSFCLFLQKIYCFRFSDYEADSWIKYKCVGG